jgi:MOSC domain-containing protein YiiM
MDPYDKAILVEQKGILGNANKGGKRQITIIQQEVWQELCEMTGMELDPRGRRANLMIKGINLEKSRGKLLRIGSTLLKINGETKPCERMDEFCLGLKELMYPAWKGGAYAEVVEGGEIRIGDEVYFVETEP